MNMKKIIATALSVTAVFSACAFASCGEQKPELIVYTEAGFAPWEFTQKGSTKIIGVDMEIAKYIADKYDWELKVVNGSFDSIVAGIAEDNALGIAGISYSESRAEAVEFSSFYWEDAYQAVVYKTASNPELIEGTFAAFMSYITTVTGIHFYPLNPNPKDIDIEDIAHALSLICRANGHFRHFYSVAQHCIACAEEAIERGLSVEVILGCLLHDASEAYLCDVTRPVKKHIPQYLRAEEKLQEVIWKRFIGRELTDAEKKLIFEIDDDILSMEFHLLMPENLNEDYRKLQGSYTCEYQDPQEVKSRFIQMATLDITVERLLEDDYWIIDILPSQIPVGKQAEYRALTDEYFERGKVAQLHRRYADILTMINSRFKTAMLCMPEALSID